MILPTMKGFYSLLLVLVLGACVQVSAKLRETVSTVQFEVRQVPFSTNFYHREMFELSIQHFQIFSVDLVLQLV